ncbi:hypothetical protein E1B28_002916 [Marasmius oreades]|uniref:Uncharacterized protein n=1 Tax=Marasmius oreades TaxID=181124 RepID=A0A9P7RKE9_9AGAR|nr:uncharacterized protein E1B28_002916 [Marasmius oreades]KAG7085350.1 hypothetical protein E1B28_002916 [Marasmius oreades]
MAERLELLLKSSPHLALLIKALHINSHWVTEWLKEDESLPFILPLLVNLERFYISNSERNSTYIFLPHLPKPVQEALFATWRSPKLTHIAMAGIRFVSFKDVLSVISQSSHSVRNIALCMVDGDDMESDGEVNANRDSGINGQSVIPGPSSTRNTESLTFNPCKDEHSAQFYTWLLNPEAKFSWSSLHKLHFYIGGEFTFEEDLALFRRILTVSPSIEELHVVTHDVFGDTWTDSGPHKPVDISSIQVLHLVVDLIESDLPILDWWCDNLTSVPSLALKDIEIYMFVSVPPPPETPLDLIPEWKHLDKILTSMDQDINLKIGLLPRNAGNFYIVPEDLNLCFPRLRDKGRLEINCVYEAERCRQVEGQYWV